MAVLSVIVPCYNEEESIPEFYVELKKIIIEMSFLEFEILFIDDGSTDRTMDVVHTLAQEDTCVKFVSFSRNFGKEAAIYAGMKESTGDFVVLIDADLQHPPALLKDMYEAIQNGYDCAATRRISRKGEPAIRSFFAKIFYRIMGKISHIELVYGAQDFRMMTRQVVDAILSMSEYNRFSKGIFGWVGFKTKWIAHENVQRVAGNTKWSFWGLVLYSLEGIIAFSTIPLQFCSIAGFILFLIALCGVAWVFIQYFMGVTAAFGWSSMITIILLLSGVQLFSMGILGQYVAKTYLETKNRPLYIERENNLNACEKGHYKQNQ